MMVVGINVDVVGDVRRGRGCALRARRMGVKVADRIVADLENIYKPRVCCVKIEP